MEWLTGNMQGMLAMVAVPAVLYLAGLLLSRERTYGWGYRMGRLFMTLAIWERMKPVTNGKIKDRICNTLTDFFSGVVDALSGKEKSN